VIVERDLHPQKQDLQNFSTEEGIQIVESDEQLQNAEGSIHESLESDSKVIVERERHPLKEHSRIFSTEEGIQTAWRSSSSSSSVSSSRLISLTSTRKPETTIKRRGNSKLSLPRK
jgi:hypothetical protein